MVVEEGEALGTGRHTREPLGSRISPYLSLSLWKSLSTPMGICCDPMYPHIHQSLRLSQSLSIVVP